ncbi:MAG TPA: DUF1552 domain-containing protein [Oligoflexus sp.]|uniref:DUF1552 domain-containing protein n=1 Tax=Oligoflexus sp. TaxID=1971216 RepID=UPI002D7F9C6E|nr:DUF1552 domain-containing protein [Oligoflexus sp.]HET9236803.1 DUF1552 domain-containing protein [Oligoflexus sp.]
MIQRTRRAILKDLGLLASTPLLGNLGLSLFPMDEAFGQTVGGKPLKFLAISFPHGAVNGDWEPKRLPDGSFTLLESKVLAPLEPFKNRLAIFSGLGHETLKPNGSLSSSSAHAGLAASFTGLASGDSKGSSASLDYALSQHLFKSDKVLRVGCFLSYNAAQGLDDTPSEICYSGAGDSNRLSVIAHPQKSFDKAFAAFTSSAPTAEETSKKQAEENINNLVKKQLARLEKRLKGDELNLLLKHQQTIEGLGKGVNAFTCQAKPSINTAGFTAAEASMATLTQRQADVVAAALACGTVSLASIEIMSRSHGSYNMSTVIKNDALTQIKDPSALLNSTNFHNDVAHKLNTEGNFNTEEQRAFNQSQRWYMEQIAYILGQLDARGILDSTVVMIGTEMGHPQHFGDAAVFMLAGGGFKMGRWFEHKAEKVQTYQHRCTPHNHLLVNVAQRFGMTANTFGDNRFTGGLPADTRGQMLEPIA